MKLTKKTIFIFAGVGILIVGLYLLLTIRLQQQQQNQLPITQEASPVSPLHVVTIGKTTDAEVAALPNKLTSETLSDGSKKYTFTAPITTRTNDIIIKNGVAIYEKIVTPEKKADTGYQTIDQYTQQYGQPEEVIQGTELYGPYSSTYIYASKGFAFIANPNTNEVYEVKVFMPMTVEEYKVQYGSDIKSFQSQPETP